MQLDSARAVCSAYTDLAVSAVFGPRNMLLRSTPHRMVAQEHEPLGPELVLDFRPNVRGQVLPVGRLGFHVHQPGGFGVVEESVHLPGHVYSQHDHVNSENSWDGVLIAHA